MILVLMGVSGAGKSTTGKALSNALGWRLLDADDFHPPANVAKMHAGIALTDDDRDPWLTRLADELRAVLAHGESAVLACSALRQAYRDRIGAAGDVRFVYLEGDYTTIAVRVARRHHHFMPPGLLRSQFATLEEPHDALRVDIRREIPEQVQAIVDAYALSRCNAG